MSILDNEHIIEADFQESLMKSQYEVIKGFLYKHMSYVIYNHFIGEIVVPSKYKCVPILQGDEFKSTGDKMSMVDVIKKNYRYILKARSKAANGGIHLTIAGDDDYVTIVGEFLMIHSSIEFEGCKTVFVSSYDWRVKYCKIMIDGGGNRYTLKHVTR